MRVAFITVGNAQRLTGGYLYHARVFDGLRAQGLMIDEISASDAPLEAQLAASAAFGAAFEPQLYDVIVIDALARGVCGPWIERWRTLRPVVAMVHQLPSVAEAESAQIVREQQLEAPLLRADRLIAVSEHGREILIACGAPADRVAIVSPGFDRLPIQPKQARDRRVQDEPLRVLCVAQWIARKGLTTLIAAWQQLRPADAVLELIGETDADPEYAREVQALLAGLAAEQVIVRGVVTDDELQQAYGRADLFVLPSRFEGYGMVYAEALAHGLPIVACDVGPVPALITPQAGLFVPPDDASALAQSLARLLHDPALRAQLSAGAIGRAAALPDWAETTRRFAEVLTQAASEASNRSA
ncbi:MAG: glycosyltransferase family 4 protein [Chloroflexi bacterium]|nr:glycosyltransferase family 4 protein [Chloroflexota bacterium]